MAPLCTLGLALWADAPQQEVTAVALCRELARVATGGADGSIWLWETPHSWHPLAQSRAMSQQKAEPEPGDAAAQTEPDSEECFRPLSLLVGLHESAITSLTCSHDSQTPVLVSTDSSGAMCVWRLEDGICLRGAKGVTCPPSTIANVSCKGRPLVACAGASADIEVVDVLRMKRVVRLFGHGEWCIDLCARGAGAPLADATAAPDEPTLYSIDRGGTLCCWLADRSCAPGVVSWLPAVQVSAVPVAFPAALALDPRGAALLVVGLGGAAVYALGADHKLADLRPKGYLAVDILDCEPDEAAFAHAPARGGGGGGGDDDGGADPPEQRRRRRHASRAFRPKDAVRQWSSAPPEDFEEALAAQERAERGGAAVLSEGGCEDRPSGAGGGGARGWVRARGALSPGGDRAVVWVDGVGAYAVSFGGERGALLLGSDAGAAGLEVLGGDGAGWLIGASSGARLHVWRPVGPSAPPPGDGNGAAALRLRAARAAGADGAAEPSEPGADPEPDALRQLLEGGWVYERGAQLSDGFAWGSARAEPHGKTTAALVQVEAGRPMRWLLGGRSGGVKVLSLPTGKVLQRLGTRGAAVRALLCVPDSDTLLVGSDDGTVTAWDVGEARKLYAFRQHVGAVSRFVWLGKQLWATIRQANVFCSLGADGHVMVATTQTTSSAGESGGPAVLYLLGGHGADARDVRWAERLGCVCVLTVDGAAHLWQLRDHGGADCVRRVLPAAVPAVLGALERSSGGGPVLHADAAPPGEADARGEGAGEEEGGAHDALFGEAGGGGAEAVAAAAAAAPLSVGARGGGVASVVVLRCDAIAAAAAQLPAAAVPSPAAPPAARQPSGLSSSSAAEDDQDLLAAAGAADGGGRAAEVPRELLWARLGGEGAAMAVALSTAMSGFAQPRVPLAAGAPRGAGARAAEAYAVRVRDALAALGVPLLLEARAESPAQLHASLALPGGAGGATLLVPRGSWACAPCAVSPAVTGALTASAAVLVDACRSAAAAGKVDGAQLCGALLHFLSKEAPARLAAFRDADVVTLAHFWLVAPEGARATAQALLSARLARTQPAARQEIVAEWTAKLETAPAAAASAGLAGREGPAVIVLAVIGAHFADVLNKATATRVARALVAALGSADLLHSKVASHLLARGAPVWCRHLPDGQGLVRTLYARYWRWQDFATSAQEAELALRSVAPMLPSEFVEVIGEEASRHSQLVCHVRSERSVTAIRVLVAMIKRHPLPMLPALPRAVEVVLSTLDPAHPLVRQALMQHSTAALKEIVRRFPQATFHQETQRFAVGTVDALVVIFDVRTATKWRVLEGHEGAISAVTFDSAGQRLATFSAAEGRVRFWEAGTSGPFGLFSSKVGRCVQQFTVPHEELGASDANGSKEAQALAFGILFTPNAIVLTRDGHPVCEFPIK